MNSSPELSQARTPESSQSSHISSAVNTGNAAEAAELSQEPRHDEQNGSSPSPAKPPDSKVQMNQEEPPHEPQGRTQRNLGSDDGNDYEDDIDEIDGSDTDDLADSDHEDNHRNMCLACNGDSFESKVLGRVGSDLALGAYLTPLLHAMLCQESPSAGKGKTHITQCPSGDQDVEASTPYNVPGDAAGNGGMYIHRAYSLRAMRIGIQRSAPFKVLPFVISNTNSKIFQVERDRSLTRG